MDKKFEKMANELAKTWRSELHPANEPGWMFMRWTVVHMLWVAFRLGRRYEGQLRKARAVRRWKGMRRNGGM